MKSIYIAGRFSRREEFQGYMHELEARGWTVTSRWLKHSHTLDMQTPGAYKDSERAKFAADDLADVVNAEHLLYFTEDFQASRTFLARRGGRHVELGVALGVGNLVHLVGPRENIFCYLPVVRWYQDFKEFALNENDLS